MVRFKDSRTIELGPRTSNFHDEVTLLFLQPVINNGEASFHISWSSSE